MLALLAGSAMGLIQAPFSFFWILFLSVPAIWWLLSKQQRGFAIGWWAGLGYFSVTLHWIVEPFLVDIARTGWMAPFALMMKAGGHALFWGAGFALARIIAPGRGTGAVLALVACWTLAEYGRSTLLTGFPWALIAYGWVETPVRLIAGSIGPHGLGALSLFVAMLPVASGRLSVLGTLAAVILLVGATFLGNLPFAHNTAPTNQTVRLIQPNAEQHLKWDPDWVPVFYNRMLDFTEAPGDVDVVIWPEVAVPYLVDERLDLNAAIAGRNPEARVILGARRVERGASNVWYNSLAVLNADGSLDALYDKHHLVPFGEYMPYPDLWDRFGLQALAQHGGRFSGGEQPRTISVDGLPPFQPLICYEMIFPHEMQTGANRPEWLLHVTNDAWFGNFSGPYQHLVQAQFRAVENGLPVARAANTGVSAMIDPTGRIVASLPLNSEGYLDVSLPRPLPAPPYARMGDQPVILALILLGIAGFGLQRRARRA